MEPLEHNFENLVRVCILLIELAGIAVIVISMVRGFIRKDEHTRISLAQGIMLGLEFKIGSEVLRSVIVTTWNELGTLAAIILLRSLLTLLLHWEIGEEEKREKEKALQKLSCVLQRSLPFGRLFSDRRNLPNDEKKAAYRGLSACQKTFWEVSEGRSPPTLVPKLTTCASASEALLSKAFLTPFAARRAVRRVGKRCFFGGKDRRRRAFSTA